MPQVLVEPELLELVFAIKAALGIILPNTTLASSYIEQEPDRWGLVPAPLRPAWYDCVHPFSEQYCQVWFEMPDRRILREPTGYAVGADNGVAFQILVADNIEGKPNSIIKEHAGRNWIISGADGVVDDGYCGDGYSRFERSPENSDNPLPPYGSWYLGELPAIRPATP